MGSREAGRSDSLSIQSTNQSTNEGAEGGSMGRGSEQVGREEQPAKTKTATPEEIEEQRKIRRLQLMMNMVMSVISQDESLTVDEAAEMVADTKRAALAMFPDKELAYNLIYKPRLQRLMRERYRIQ